MKIAFFIDALKENLDGVSNTSHQIIHRLDQHGIEPIFFTPLPPEDKAFKYKAYVTRYLTFPYAKDYRLAIPRKQRIFQILDEFQPDIIHWSTPSTLGKMALRYSKSRNVPNLTIYHAHFNSYLGYFKKLPFKGVLLKFLDSQIKKVYNKSDAVLAPTQEMKQYLQHVGVTYERLQVWGRGVDCERFDPMKANEDFFKRWKVPSGVNLLFVSRLVHYKETDLLIRLSHELPSGQNLIIVGDGPEESKMRKRARKTNTFFTGRLEGEELSTAYASSDIFIFPSISETFGNVVLEALASGLPVIAANGGGPRNIIKDQETGFLVEPKKWQAFLEKIEVLNNNRELKEGMSSEARKYAQSVSWEQLVTDLVAFYQSLV